MLFRILFIYTLIGFALSKAQVPEVDTILLNNIVITGQVVPSKIDQSVYAVEVISAKRIKQSAANNLADLLNQTLNIQIIPDNRTGKSNISMFGLDSEYVKVLVDNIPLVNDEGFGNFTDFSQINLEDIQQIEIVEGSTGVDYGVDAAAGIINIITKKNFKRQKASVFIQEESVGTEYNFFNRGRHIKGVNIKSKIYKDLSGSITYNQNTFDGWLNNNKGKSYYGNQDLRGHEFLPKKQYDLKSTFNYKLNRVNLFYTLNYFTEELFNYNARFDEGYNPSTDLYNPYAQDRRSPTTRWVHHLNVNKAFDAWTTNVSLSYQKQEKSVEDYTYYIIPNTESNNVTRVYESKEVFYTKALVGKKLLPSVWNIQAGTELNVVKGFQSPIARTVDTSGEDKVRELGSFDVFTSSEIHAGNSFAVRPGIRALFSSQFNTQIAYSISGSYKLNNNWEFRLLYGNAPKLPNFEQLYTSFIDVNHFVVGNEDLKPENTQSVFLHTFYKKQSKSELEAKLTAWYLNVDDQIDFITSSIEPLEYTYQNIENFTNLGISLSSAIKVKNLSIRLGANYTGESYDSTKSDMLYSWNGNFGLNYFLSKYKSSISCNIKRNGKEYQWIRNTDTDELQKEVRESYYWTDISARKTFLQNWEFIIGVRNLFNITTLNNTTQVAEAHNQETTTEMFAYGRSFFGRLTYNIHL